MDERASVLAASVLAASDLAASVLAASVMAVPVSEEVAVVASREGEKRSKRCSSEGLNRCEGIGGCCGSAVLCVAWCRLLFGAAAGADGGG